MQVRRPGSVAFELPKQTESVAGGVDITLGDEGDIAAPRVAWRRWEPGRKVEPHTHPCDYLEIILEGSQRVGKEWFYPGHVRVVSAGTGYGPLEAGPDGVTFVAVFASSNFDPIFHHRDRHGP